MSMLQTYYKSRTVCILPPQTYLGSVRFQSWIPNALRLAPKSWLGSLLGVIDSVGCLVVR